MRHANNGNQPNAIEMDSFAQIGDFAEPAGERTATIPPVGGAGYPAAYPGPAGDDPYSSVGTRRRRNARNGKQRSWLWQALGILAELLLTAAAICALYIVWQMWWTGVQAQHTQQETLQSAQWSSPANGDTTKVAQAQQGDPPTQPESANEGDLIATIYIPRFGQNWERNIVQGTTLEQLNKHGLGHYTETQWPGQVGNFAIAGHRNGYGQPLGDVDKLQEGDAIIVRTQDYWYVYQYTSKEIVLPTEVRVIGADPQNPGGTPTKRMITMTTCEPKYSDPIYRWISYGELKYWAKVSDGVPQELATNGGNGGIAFTNNATSVTDVAAQLDSLEPVMLFAVLAYVVIFLAALAAWRFPVLRAIRSGARRRPDASIYGWLARHQPGVLPVRVVLLLILALLATCALFQWGFPWAASNIPYLRQMSNFTV
ncbi:class E sortase [Bifidobacterium aerophilum]